MTARTVGGAEIYVERLTAALADACRFTVALSDHPELADLGRRLAGRAEVLTFPFDRAGALPSVARQLRQLGRAADVIHLNSNHPGSRLGILMGFTLPGAGRPVVCVEQGASPIAAVEVPGSIAWALPPLFRWSRRSVTQLVAVSEENKRTLVDLYRLPAGKITVVHNGAELTPFRDPSPGTLRAELGLTPDQPLVIVLGRLAANKGQRFLVEAAPAILARFPTTHFVFAGNPEGRGDIEARIRALNLEPHVSLLGFRSDVVNLLRSSDVFVLPSLAEGFSLSIIEALAAGLPVVATRVGGAAEIIDEGRNGFLVPPADAPALSEAVIRVLGLTPEEREGVRRAARETAQRFSFEATARGVLAVYRRAVPTHPESPPAPSSLPPMTSPIALTVDVHAEDRPADIRRAAAWLDEHGIPATFFVPSALFEDARFRPHVIRLPSLGFEVGSHGHEHDFVEIRALMRGGASRSRLPAALPRAVPGSLRRPTDLLCSPAWCPLGPDAIAALVKLGYRVDSSATPQRLPIFSSTPYANTWLFARRTPYELAPGLLEVPTSCLLLPAASPTWLTLRRRAALAFLRLLLWEARRRADRVPCVQLHVSDFVPDAAPPAPEETLGPRSFLLRRDGGLRFKVFLRERNAGARRMRRRWRSSETLRGEPEARYRWLLWEFTGSVAPTKPMYPNGTTNSLAMES